MAEKPSYVGLLNAIAVAEGQAECYFQAWAAVTPSDEVRQVLTTVGLREGEHSKAFEKRLCELGFAVRPRDEAKAAERAALAGRTDLSDREKFERLGLIDNGEGPDVFTSMFADPTIDIQTGALLGRYIAEERDTTRMLADCYSQLCAAGDNGSASTGGGDVARQLARIESLLEKLVDRLPA